MDSLQDTIQSILSDKEQMKKVQAMADMLIAGENNTSSNNNAQNNGKGTSKENISADFDLSSLLSMFSGNTENNTESQNSPENSAGIFDDLGITPEMLFNIQKAVSSTKEPDERVLLLNALKPYLNEKRKEKLEKLIGFLKISKAAKAMGFDMNSLDILK